MLHGFSSLQTSPPLAFRFAVFFLAVKRGQSLPDMRFKRVNGIAVTVNTLSIQEGGQNIYPIQLPARIQHGNLTLERGLALGTPLANELNVMLTEQTLAPVDALVSLLDEVGQPLTSWLFTKTYPVSWNLSAFDAESNSMVIETIELAYERMQPMEL